MKIKREIAISDFLKAVDSCLGSVYFSTDSGDLLDLKSDLARFVFLAYMDAPGKENNWPGGSVSCEYEEDKNLLKDFLTVS